MKLVDTRIRVETSEYQTDYFPELLHSYKNWYGKEVTSWSSLDTSRIVLALKDTTIPYGLAVAQAAIDMEWKFWKSKEEHELHHQTKQISYVKYP